MRTPQARQMQHHLLSHEKIAIIDLEATCYHSFEEKERYKSEVIEVGWVLLHTATGEITDKQSLYVKPTTSIVTPFCTELTGITPDMVAHAPSFSCAMSSLAALHEKHGVTLWMSQGNYDRRKLRDQCEKESVTYPLANNDWTNIKTLARHTLQRKNRLGLKSLLDDLGLPLIGQAHCGADDAFNSAQVVRELLRRLGQSELSAEQLDLIARVLHLTNPKVLHGTRLVLIDGASINDASTDSGCEAQHLKRVVARIKEVNEEIKIAFC